MFTTETKHGQLVSYLEGKVRGGEYRHDAKIPSERQLAKATGLSVITINKAISELVSKGVLHRRQGLGTFVNLQPPGNVRNVYMLAFGASEADRYVNAMFQLGMPPHLRGDYCFLNRMVPRELATPGFFASELSKIDDAVKPSVAILFSVFLDKELLERSLKLKTPTIYLGDFFDPALNGYPLNQITGDNSVPILATLEHLKSKGHRKILRLAGRANLSFYQEAAAAGRAFAVANGIELENLELPFFEREPTFEEANAARACLARSSERVKSFDALVLDGLAENIVVDCLRENHVGIPGDISVISTAGPCLAPGISCLAFDLDPFFPRVYARIEEILAGDESKRRDVFKIPVNVVERGSVKERVSAP